MGDAKKRNSDPVEKSVGGIGRWQIALVLIYCLPEIPLACLEMGAVFFAAPTNYTCVYPKGLSPCSSDCQKWEFDTSEFTNTMISEWNLVCDKEKYPSLAQMVFMSGITVGTVLTGYLSDKFGRSLTLEICCLIQGVLSVASAFIPDFWIFVVVRFFVGVCIGGSMMIPLVLTLEFLGEKWRAIISLLSYQLIYYFGNFFLVFLAYFIRDWRYLLLATSLPSFLAIIFTWLPESPRWLIATGRTEKAIAILKQGARFNHLPDDKIEKYVMEAANCKSSDRNKTGSFLYLLKIPKLRYRLFVIVFIFVVVSISFYGITFYIGEISKNIFLNMMLLAAVNFPGLFTCVIWFQFFGRKWLMFAALFFGGTTMIFLSFFLDATLVCSGLAMFFVSVAMTDLNLYSGELFPTVVRNTALGIGSMGAHIASIFAPLTSLLSLTHPRLPPLIFGIPMVIGAAVLLYLPETAGKSITETSEFEVKVQKNSSDVI